MPRSCLAEVTPSSWPRVVGSSRLSGPCGQGLAILAQVSLDWLCRVWAPTAASRANCLPDARARLQAGSTGCAWVMRKVRLPGPACSPAQREPTPQHNLCTETEWNTAVSTCVNPGGLGPDSGGLRGDAYAQTAQPGAGTQVCSCPTHAGRYGKDPGGVSTLALTTVTRSFRNTGSERPAGGADAR